MARFELRFKRSVEKDFRGIPKPDVRRILKTVEALCDEPRPAGSEKLTGQEFYRVRQGAYRVIYSIDDVRIVVEVVKVGHRREVYR